jgi:xanthine/uracil/vitamin C permease (AzgA family)
MNVLFWVLQGLFALHTGVGAIWKLSNPAQVVPSLHAIPRGVWLGLSGVELRGAAALILPAIHKPSGGLVPFAAAFIAAEMLVFSGLHLVSGEENHGPLFYWLTVAALCGLIAYGRLALQPLGLPTAR